MDAENRRHLSRGEQSGGRCGCGRALGQARSDGASEGTLVQAMLRGVVRGLGF